MTNFFNIYHNFDDRECTDKEHNKNFVNAIRGRRENTIISGNYKKIQNSENNNGMELTRFRLPHADNGLNLSTVRVD